MYKQNYSSFANIKRINVVCNYFWISSLLIIAYTQDIYR